MEGTSPGSSKGYQKQIKKDAPPPPKQKIHPSTDYSSPAAKKWPKFVDAIKSGDVDGVKQFIDEGLNVNLVRDGVTPLMIAASAGKTDVAQALLEAGVNINEKGEDGGTALHSAALQEDAAVVELLMESGVDVAAKNKAGKTALQLAEDGGRSEVVRAVKQHLSQQTADAREWEEFLNSEEGRPFKAQRQYDSLTRYAKLWWTPIPAMALLAGGIGLLFDAPVIAGLAGALIGAAAGGVVPLREKRLRSYLDGIGPLPELDLQTLRRKREAGEPIFAPKTGDEPAGQEDFSGTLAAEEASLPPTDESSTLEAEAPETVIIEEGTPIEPQKSGRRISKAVIIGTAAAAVVALLAGGVYLKKDALLRIFYAKKLERGGVAYTDKGFLEAVANNNESALDLFIKAGAPVNALNEKGQSALMIAAEKGYVNLLEKLVRLDPSKLNQTDRSGRTALMAAARQGREPSVQALLALGAHINFVVPSNPGAATALQAALDVADFREENLAMVKYLLDQGADVKTRNGAGQTPLMFAVDRGRTEAARLLLDKGAETDAVDSKGGFPLLLAACKGNAALVTLLAQRGTNMKAALPDGQTPLMCAVQMGSADTVKALLDGGADANAKTADRLTALYEATKMGQLDIAKLLVAAGADPRDGVLPDAFKTLKGKTVALNVKKSKILVVLGKLVKPASLDGYTLHADGALTQTVTVKTKAPWNAVLRDLAAKNRFLLFVKDKEIFLLPAKQHK
jgi:ankyrin repeat protein